MWIQGRRVLGVRNPNTEHNALDALIYALKNKVCRNSDNNPCKIHNAEYCKAAFELFAVLKQNSKRYTAVGYKPCKERGQVDNALGVHTCNYYAACAVGDKPYKRRYKALRKA